MKKLHIANTFFEYELQEERALNLSEMLAHNAIFRQLQFLPLLYAPKDDGILVSDLPEQAVSSYVFYLCDNFDATCFEAIESWGYSLCIAKFAKKHRIPYCMPNWEVVKQVNSKQFSFEHSPKLHHSTLLHNEEEARTWIRSFKGKKILKTCFGLSGQGHFFIDTNWEKTLGFLQKQWKKSLPVIAEPWVERVFDFSTQWFVHAQTIAYLGATICVNDTHGHYRYTEVTSEKELFAGKESYLHEHQHIAMLILKEMQNLGYFGNVGIDAMVYRYANKTHLHPIVEINARKTMGWLALRMYQNQGEKPIRVCYEKSKHGLLPKAIRQKNGTIFRFSRNLICN